MFLYPVLSSLMPAVFLLSGRFYGQWHENYMPHYGPHWMGWSGMGWLGLAMHVLFWIVVICLIIFIARWLMRTMGTCGRATETALDILKKRYARGEIGKEEFDAKKKDLSD